jgi:alpha-galactosidase
MLNGYRKAMLATGLLCAITVTFAREVAPTPPMGWNSWDSFGLTIDEDDFKANALQLAKLRAFGWTYAVIDEGWYMGNPFGDKLQSRQYFLDAHGLLIPAPARYPSSADHQGFKPLADWLHSRGLKFGLHIVRGIPKQAVENNLPIAGSFHAVDAADTADTCGWDDGNYGVRDNPAGQAYYDSMLSLYAGWGLDFLKVDCIADHPYKASEIRQIAAAIRKTGRPIVLSLSPGPTQPAHAAEIRKYGQMWRISNDIWDRWRFGHEPPKEDDFPMGVRDIFDRLRPWIGQARDGHWPDADMLPFGMLAPHPGLGEPRHTHLTLDEERTQLTLLAMARSPLILGANLTKLDAQTRALITNRDVISVNQTARDNHPVENLPAGLENVRVWVAAGMGRQQSQRFVAVFNLDDAAASLEVPWGQLGLDSGSFAARDLWEGHHLGASDRLKIVLPAHGCVLYAVRSTL